MSAIASNNPNQVARSGIAAWPPLLRILTLATMTVQTRARESLLPIVMLPIALPVLLASVRASMPRRSSSPKTGCA